MVSHFHLIHSSNEPLRSNKLVDQYLLTAAAALLEYTVAETEPMKLLVVALAVLFSNLVATRLISKTTSLYALSPFSSLFSVSSKSLLSFSKFDQTFLYLLMLIGSFFAICILLTTRLSYCIQPV